MLQQGYPNQVSVGKQEGPIMEGHFQQFDKIIDGMTDNIGYIEDALHRILNKRVPQAPPSQAALSPGISDVHQGLSNRENLLIALNSRLNDIRLHLADIA
jgi:hypothetical protein